MKKQTNLKSRQLGNEQEIDSLIKSFDDRYSKSNDKDTLLKREIEAHELLFDNMKLPLIAGASSNNRPLKHLQIYYTDGEINKIRDSYIKYIVNGDDIKDTGEYFHCKKEELDLDNDIYFIDNKNRYFKKFPPSNIEIHNYIEANKRFLYLNWLRTFVKGSIRESEKELSLQEKALISFYEGDIITRDKGKLYQHYSHYSTTSTRIGTESDKYGNFSLTRTLNKIKRIEKIIPHLSESAQKTAIDEVKTLRAALDKETL